jgi:esterase/lipase superfamily enzyme
MVQRRSGAGHGTAGLRTHRSQGSGFSHARGALYDYENWGLVDALRHSVDAGFIRLFCVDGIDSESLYCRSIPPTARTKRHWQYERYMLQEVIPFMLSENGVPSIIAHGCSIGAYHAVNIALRHPSLFCKVVAVSGRYDLTRAVGPFQDLFSGHYDQDIYFLTPNHFLQNLEDPCFLEPMRQLDVRLVVGEHDPFRESNHVLSDALWRKGIGHELAIWPGEAHKPRCWREMIPHYL